MEKQLGGYSTSRVAGADEPSSVGWEVRDEADLGSDKVNWAVDLLKKFELYHVSNGEGGALMGL